MFSTIWYTQRFTELGREEKGEAGDRGYLVEKKESPKEEMGGGGERSKESSLYLLRKISEIC